MGMQQALKVLDLFRSDARTASGNGTSVDLQGYVNPGIDNMKAYLDVGTVSGTTPTLDVKIQESSDNVTFTDITGATFTQVTATGANQEIHFVTSKRYVRAVATIGGTTPSFSFGVYLLAEQRQK